ncbi:unnamed protein product [Parajaminaea phylloscopi]
MTMPAPIPITRVADPSSSASGSSSGFGFTGSYRMGTSFGNSFPTSNSAGGSASFREAMMMATSFGKDVNDLIDYSANRFASSVDSEMTIAPSTSLGKLESTFCRDFSCCGQELGDLHDLLQHYEECHVRFDDDGMPGMIDDDDSNSSGGSVSTPSSVPPSPRTANAKASAIAANKMTGLSAGGINGDGKKRGLGLNTDVAGGAGALDSPSANKGKKRSFGQFDAAAVGANGAPGASVHQSLRRALIDGGVGARSNRSTPSVYSANSPFSTPGSSIPGTPIADDHEFAFGGPTGLSAFSALSLRPANVNDHLPACAPPNLFFPAPGSTSGAGANATTPGLPALHLGNLGGVTPTNAASSQPPAKRERITSSGSTGPGGEKLDRDGKVIEKPFKCPNPGCDKAYKQANGLKYHRLHGSCNRNLAVKAGATPTPTSATTSGSKQTQATASTAARSAAAPAATASPVVTAAPATAPPSGAPAAASSSVAGKSVQNAKPATPVTSPPQAQQQQLKQTQPAVQAHNAQTRPSAPLPSGGPNASKPVVNTTKNLATGNAPVKPSLPLPAHINSAALAAAAALLQRGGPLPASLQGQNGPIDTASLLKTLQMLQQQMAAQQGTNSAGNADGSSNAAASAPVKPSNVPTGSIGNPLMNKGSIAPGAPTGAASATTATSSGGAALSKIAPVQQLPKQPAAALGNPRSTASPAAPATVTAPTPTTGAAAPVSASQKLPTAQAVQQNAATSAASPNGPRPT